MHVFAGGTRMVSKLVRQPRDVDGDGVVDPIANCANPPWGWTNGNGNPGGNSGNCPGQGNGNGGGGSGPEVFESDQYFYHPDHLGSSSYVTDIDGEIFQHLEYFPFGETWVEESSNTQRTPYLFTGKELDEQTGLYYFGARYYDPRTSVWQSPDPILASYMGGERSSGGVANPRNLNLFGYSHNRPVIGADPNGAEVEFHITGRFNSVNGTLSHGQLRATTSTLGFRPEVAIFQGFGARGGGMFERRHPFGGSMVPGMDKLVGALAYNGVPDGLRQTSPTTAEYMDRKPISHRDSPRLQIRDEQQQVRWEASARLFGVTLTPADTSGIVPRTRSGRIVSAAGIHYDILAYPGDRDGIAYYDLVINRDATRAHYEKLARGMAEGLENALKIIPLPGPRRGPGCLGE